MLQVFFDSFFLVDNKCETCIKRQNQTTESESKKTTSEDKTVDDLELTHEMESLINWATPQNSGSFANAKKIVAPPRQQRQTVAEVISNSEEESICPVCCLIFSSNSDISQFHQHVESHFIADDHPDYNVL